METFLAVIIKILEKVKRKIYKNHIILRGDFNIDLPAATKYIVTA